MHSVKKLVDQIDEEVCDAKKYAECYIEHKVKNDSFWANRYREMAMDELKHADYIHEKAVAVIEELRKVFTAPVEMEEEWDKSHRKFVERVAWVKQMLNM